VSEVSGQVLSAPRADSVNTFAAPDVVTPAALDVKLVRGKPVLTLAPRPVAEIAVSQ
jgi:alpha-N-arabinofuranosidase